MTRLHVGCGGYWVPGWLNVGLLSSEVLRYGTLRKLRGADVLNFNAVHGLPVEDGQLDFIYGSHFIDYLSFAQAESFLRESFRALRPGGRIRLTFTDLHKLSGRYVAGDTDYFRRLNQLTTSQPGLETNAEIFMGQIFGWGGHAWCFDAESMTHLLRVAGFQEIRTTGFRETSLPDIHTLEPDLEEKHMQTMYIEAIRP